MSLPRLNDAVYRHSVFSTDSTTTCGCLECEEWHFFVCSRSIVLAPFSVFRFYVFRFTHDDDMIICGKLNKACSP